MTALNNPTATMNGLAFAYKPNTLKHNDGKGERKSRVKSTGGKNVQLVTTTDQETAFCTGSFELISDSTSSALVDGWRDLFDGNIMTVTENGVTKTLQQLTITNNVDLEYGADAMIALEFTSLAPV